MDFNGKNPSATLNSITSLVLDIIPPDLEKAGQNRGKVLF